MVEKLTPLEYPQNHFQSKGGSAAEAARGEPRPTHPPLPAPPLPPLDSIPEELRPLKRWVAWCYRIKEGKPRKVPLQPNGSNARVNDPTTWSTLDEAHEAARRYGWGIGIVLGEVEPGRYLVGVDLDGAYEDGAITPGAARVLAELRSYTEFSPSGRGVHVVAWSAEPPETLKEKWIEIYCDARYFTWTADTLTGRDQIAWRTDELRALRERIATESGRAAGPEPQAERQAPPQPQPETPPPPDDAVQQAARILAAAWPGEGLRNACFLSLAGACARGGVPQEAAEDLAEAIYERLWPHHPDRHQARAEVRATYRKFAAGEEVTGYNSLREFVGETAAAEAMRLLGAKPKLHVIDGGRERILRPDGDARVELEVFTGRMAELAERAEAVLAQAPGSDLFQGGGRLVYPAREVGADGTASYALVTVDEHALALRLSEQICFVKIKNGKGGIERAPCDTPTALPRLMLARRGRWTYRRLRGISAAPLLRPDGMTLVAEDGYDAESQLLFAGLPKIPEIPGHPKRSDAIQALERLFGLFGEFCFSSLLDQSVAAAAAMTAAVRPSLGPSPMLFVGAPSPGSGKSYLEAVIGALCAGLRPAVIASSGCDMVELDKRIVSSLLAGCTVLILDNLSYMLSSDVLCQLISAETPLKLRPLGASTEVTIEPQVLALANGNNVRPAEDLLRRVIYCRLDPKTERPELRQYTHAPLEEALTNRGEYIADVITIIRAWHCAGQPERLEPLAGFQRWSDWIRSSLYWLTGIDVATSIERLREQDGALSNLEAVLTAWHDAFGSDPVTIKEVLREAEQESRTGLREALLAACGWRGELEPRRVGNWVESKLEREVGNLRFELVGKDSHSKVNLWRVARGPFK